MRNEIDRAEMEAAVGCELGVSPWFMMDQARIDAFADVDIIVTIKVALIPEGTIGGITITYGQEVA